MIALPSNNHALAVLAIFKGHAALDLAYAAGIDDSRVVAALRPPVDSAEAIDLLLRVGRLMDVLTSPLAARTRAAVHASDRT